ncbi:ATP-dependent DNA helicase [Frankliniella fusca]|uniref:ATP-dependent DNA helicase n=1 Tax=Frankliniella fusca TaxID=407009 RepID=A0AAE1HFH6_9NEOP|nr:ATP-dependent DNA helicase [Frankliniella fusca]
MLSQRFEYNVSNQQTRQFKDAIRLFATKEEVKTYNMKQLSDLKNGITGAQEPVARIKAKHNCCKAMKATTDQAEGLEANLYLVKDCKIMLRQNLWTEKGLVNGARGRVHDIIYQKNDVEFPSVILCEFDTYTGPSLIPNSKSMTLDKAVVDIGDREFALGLTYVALTRVRSLDHLIIAPFIFNRMEKINNHKQFIERRDFMNWLHYNDCSLIIPT